MRFPSKVIAYFEVGVDYSPTDWIQCDDIGSGGKFICERHRLFYSKEECLKKFHQILNLAKEHSVSLQTAMNIVERVWPGMDYPSE